MSGHVERSVGPHQERSSVFCRPSIIRKLHLQSDSADSLYLRSCSANTTSMQYLRNDYKPYARLLFFGNVVLLLLRLRALSEPEWINALLRRKSLRKTCYYKLVLWNSKALISIRQRVSSSSFTPSILNLTDQMLNLGFLDLHRFLGDTSKDSYFPGQVVPSTHCTRQAKSCEVHDRSLRRL